MLARDSQATENYRPRRFVTSNSANFIRFDVFYSPAMSPAPGREQLWTLRVILSPND